VIRFLVALSLLALASTAHAQDRWERSKGDCEDVFRGWRNASVDRLATCVMTWEMHRDAAQVDGDWRAIVHGAFDKLYREGDKRQAHMALSALKRLTLRPKSLRDDAAPRDRSAAPVTEIEPEAPAIDPERARALYSRGVRAMKGGDVPGALADFLDAADADPSYPQPLYRAAQCYVRLNKGAPAVATLERMKAIDSDVSAALIDRARTDPHAALPLEHDQPDEAGEGVFVQPHPKSVGRRRPVQHPLGDERAGQPHAFGELICIQAAHGRRGRLFGGERRGAHRADQDAAPGGHSNTHLDLPGRAVRD